MRPTSCVVFLLRFGNAADLTPGPHHPVGKPSGFSPSVLLLTALNVTNLTIQFTPPQFIPHYIEVSKSDSQRILVRLDSCCSSPVSIFQELLL